jgi:hypothetical protein
LSAEENSSKLEVCESSRQKELELCKECLERLADPPLWDDPKFMLAVGVVAGVTVIVVAMLGNEVREAWIK